MRGRQLFFPGIDHFHRPSFAEPGQGHGNNLCYHGSLAAKSASRISRDEADLIDGDPQSIGQLLRPAVRSIRGRPDCVMVLRRIVLGHRGVGLHGSMGYGMDVELILKKLVGLGKSGFYVSQGVGPNGTYVCSGYALERAGTGIFPKIFMDQGCAFGQGFPGIEDCRQLFVPNLDFFQGLLGFGFRGGRHSHYRFSHMADPIDGQKRLIPDHAAEKEGKIFSRNDGLNPPGIFGFRNVDLDDPGIDPGMG